MTGTQKLGALQKYITFFRIRFTAGLQYRVAALAGISTQFAWGLFTVLLYKAFWEGDPDSFPMGMTQVATYMWLRQAFLALFNSWQTDSSILSDITGGNIAYELTRPLDLYGMWFTKTISMRLANATLRFLPVLLVASLVPAPYGLSLPAGVTGLVGFLVTMVLGVLVTCALVMFIYIFTFYTMQPQGVRIVFNAITDFCAGDQIPLPFLPAGMAAVLEYTPFAAMLNYPFRIYSGHIAGAAIGQCILLQIFWLIVLVITGNFLLKRALRRAVIQGG